MSSMLLFINHCVSRLHYTHAMGLKLIWTLSLVNMQLTNGHLMQSATVLFSLGLSL